MVNGMATFEKIANLVQISSHVLLNGQILIFTT